MAAAEHLAQRPVQQTGLAPCPAQAPWQHTPRPGGQAASRAPQACQLLLPSLHQAPSQTREPLLTPTTLDLAGCFLGAHEGDRLLRMSLVFLSSQLETVSLSLYLGTGWRAHDCSPRCKWDFQWSSQGSRWPVPWVLAKTGLEWPSLVRLAILSRSSVLRLLPFLSFISPWSSALLGRCLTDI